VVYYKTITKSSRERNSVAEIQTSGRCSVTLMPILLTKIKALFFKQTKFMSFLGTHAKYHRQGIIIKM